MATTGGSKTPKASLEVVRAAVLATHSAAGFVAVGGERQAARLLRAAEALTRQALALLTEPRPAVASAVDKVDKEVKKPKKKRSKPKAKATEAMDIDCGTVVDPGSGGLPEVAPTTEMQLSSRWSTIDAVGEAPPVQDTAIVLTCAGPAASADQELEAATLSSCSGLDEETCECSIKHLLELGDPNNVVPNIRRLQLVGNVTVIRRIMSAQSKQLGVVLGV